MELENNKIKEILNEKNIEYDKFMNNNKDNNITFIKQLKKINSELMEKSKLLTEIKEENKILNIKISNLMDDKNKNSNE